MARYALCVNEQVGNDRSADRFRRKFGVLFEVRTQFGCLSLASSLPFMCARLSRECCSLSFVCARAGVQAYKPQVKLNPSPCLEP